MKKRTLLRLVIILTLGLLLIVGGNVKAINQLNNYLPVIFRNYEFTECGSFFDDFSDPNSGWFVGEDVYAIWQYLQGEYRILSKDDNYLFFSVAPTCALENYTVEVDARWVDSTGESYGILFGISGFFDRFNLFDMNTDYQEFRVLHFDGVEWQIIVPITYSSSINSGLASNHLKVTRNGYQITLEVNGTILGTWLDGNITGATYTGIISNPYTGYPISDARFDNFSISSPSIRPPPTTEPPPPTETPNCDPSYPTVCIPPPPPDLDCSDIPYTNFPVLPPDPHNFDNDGDGIGCEARRFSNLELELRFSDIEGWE